MAVTERDGKGHLADFVREAEELAREPGGALVALDGRCGGGKTTLARRLARHRGWKVIPMDGFFLRPEQRTPERYRTPGENVDHERFLEEVLRPLEAGRRAVYRPFDCHTGELGEPVAVEPGGVILIEGSYSCHRDLREHYRLRAFLDVDRDEQLRRLLGREGEEKLRAFRERWIPLEEAYFAQQRVAESCQYRLKLG